MLRRYQPQSQSPVRPTFWLERNLPWPSVARFCLLVLMRSRDNALVGQPLLAMPIPQPHTASHTNIIPSLQVPSTVSSSIGLLPPSLDSTAGLLPLKPVTPREIEKRQFQSACRLSVIRWNM